jgi:RNA polymerase sigma factor (sigma-70 family)
LCWAIDKETIKSLICQPILSKRSNSFMVNLEQSSQSENEEIKIENKSAIPTDSIKYKVEKLEARGKEAKSPQARVLYSIQVDALIEERNKMIVENQGLARYYVNKAIKKGRAKQTDREDLLQSATIGLLIGCDRFSPNREYKLSTYVSWWIRHSVNRFIENNIKPIRIPVHMQDDIRQINHVINKSCRENGHPPEIHQIAETIGATENKVRKIIKTRDTIYPSPYSLDAPISEDSNGNTMITLYENCPAWADHRSGINKEKLILEFKKAAEAKLHSIEPSPETAQRLCDILFEYFGMGELKNPQTLQGLGKIHDLSKERVRQIKQRALKHIQADPKLMIILEKLGEAYSIF